MPANNFEYRLAKNDGIKFHFLTNPIEFIGNHKVEGIKCTKMMLGEEDESGRRKPIPVKDSEFIIEADMVIYALGQQANSNLFNSIPDLKISNGRVIVDEKTFQTTHPKIFAGGDCINGGKETVNAAYDGKQAAFGIDQYLMG
jgi:glutamate synthase (NADPH/NADH) small chain